jgi:hypothetical protein
MDPLEFKGLDKIGANARATAKATTITSRFSLIPRGSFGGYTEWNHFGQTVKAFFHFIRRKFSWRA